jgi:sugar/nucleoside kinase (ribokinase family)
LSLLTGQQETKVQAQSVLGLGVKIVVFKLGSNGVATYTHDSHSSAQPVPIKVMSTIGAGGGLAAGFHYALDRDLPLEKCVRYGNAVAAAAVSRVCRSDAKPGATALADMLPKTNLSM